MRRLKRKRSAAAGSQDASVPLLTSVFRAHKADSVRKLERKPQARLTLVARLLAGDRQAAVGSLMAEPIIAATQIFDHIQLPESPQVKEHLDVLLDHYDAKGFLALGGTRSEVHREWTRLNTLILRDDILRTLPLHVLYARLFLHFTASHQNVLLLAALVQALAIDAALCRSETAG